MYLIASKVQKHINNASNCMHFHTKTHFRVSSLCKLLNRKILYHDATDSNQAPTTLLIYHHGESRKACRTTYRQCVTELLNSPFGYQTAILSFANSLRTIHKGHPGTWWRGSGEIGTNSDIGGTGFKQSVRPGFQNYSKAFPTSFLKCNLSNSDK